MKPKSIFSFLFAILLLANFNLQAQQMNSDAQVVSSQNNASSTKSSAHELKTAMRKLWEDHIMWTRNVIFCVIDDLPGTGEAVTRLLKNQDDIGNAIKPYYGEEAGNKLTALLRVHITTAADVLKAMKSNDKAALDAANKKWFDNADEIASFLSQANTNWPLENMKMMMHEHLKLTAEEAMARKTKDYMTDVAAYENVHQEILKMADMLTEGIVKQFSDKFADNEPVGGTYK
jgi:hypothetical protein